MWLLGVIISAVFSSPPIIFVVLCGIFVLFRFGYLPVYLKTRKITKENGHLIFERGVFISRRTVLPNEFFCEKTEYTLPIMKKHGVCIVSYRYPTGKLRMLIKKEESEDREK